jgi:hypothetical protein
MTTYYVNEAAFGLPGGHLVDRTETRLSVASGDGGAVTLTVHRQPLPPGESLSAAVAQRRQQADRSLPSHAVLFQRDVEIASLPAIEIAAEWRDEGQRVYTRQAHVVLDGVWVIFAGNAPIEARPRCDALMMRVVSTFQRHA